MTSSVRIQRFRAGTGKARRPERGFTLFEMLVVLVIISLAAGIVAGRFVSQDKQPGDVARQAISTLRAARSEAMRDGHETRVTFDLAARSLLRDGVVAGRWPEGIEVTVEASQGESENGRYAVRFTPDGGSTGLRARFTDGERQPAALTVSWLTGEVRDAAP